MMRSVCRILINFRLKYAIANELRVNDSGSPHRDKQFIFGDTKFASKVSLFGRYTSSSSPSTSPSSSKCANITVAHKFMLSSHHRHIISNYPKSMKAFTSGGLVSSYIRVSDPYQRKLVK